MFYKYRSNKMKLHFENLDVIIKILLIKPHFQRVLMLHSNYNNQCINSIHFALYSYIISISKKKKHIKQ